MQAYIREHRALVKLCPAGASLPHPEAFYSELFSVANALISQKKTPRDY